MGLHRSVLEESGIRHADAFAAVSSGDNSNIIAARVARETFGVQKVVARIYDPKRAEVYERLGIPTVATVPWTANRLLKSVLGEATSEAWRDPSGAVALTQVAPHEGWVGKSVADFEAATGSRVGLLTRFGTGMLPTATMLIQSGDTLHALTTDALADTLRHAAERPPLGAAE
jgi:trk system potassium uptake protein TrkA